MKRFTVVGALVLTIAAAVLASGVASPASAAPTAGGLTAPSQLPVTGTPAGGGTFTGTLTDIHFVNQNGNLAVAGLLSGTLTDALGTVLGTVTNVPVTLPIGGAQAGGTCQILDLTLGPLDLNLLGLVVHLDQVHLTITAERGPGNLLGNLLCAVAGLLDDGQGGGLLANLLNRLLGF